MAIPSDGAALLAYLSILIVRTYFIYLKTAGDIEINPADTKLVSGPAPPVSDKSHEILFRIPWHPSWRA
jgi:hypothetical protein